MKRIRLKETCIVYGSVTRNRYGDLVKNSGTNELCLYRNLEQLNRGVNFREEVQIQGMFWLDGSSSVVKEGSIIGYNNTLYRVENIVTAKTLLTQNSVSFYKCAVSIYRAIS